MTPRKAIIGAGEEAIALDVHNGSILPLYVQIRQLLKEDIAHGRYQPEEQLPTEDELREMYQVSRVTIRKAITDLVEEGTLTRKQGKGTFVTSKKIRNELLSISGFSEFSAELGKRPSERIVASQLIPADETLANLLLVETGSQLLRLVRLMYIDERPLFLDTAHYSLQRFPGLERKIGQDTSMYKILREDYNTEPTSNEKVIDVVLARKEEARLLACDPGVPLFKIEKIAYDRYDQPVHTSTFLCSTSRVSLSVQRMQKYPSK